MIEYNHKEYTIIMDRKYIEITELNHEIVCNPTKYILECEKAYKSQMEKIAESIKLSPEIKFILLAGPSSSGKTTTAKLIKETLKQNGFNAKTISLDDFFVERVNTPKWEDGTYNYEGVDAVDWKLFDKCMHELLNGGETIMPTYDFIAGKKFFKNKLVLGKKDIIVIEGLHSLNPVIDNFISTNFSLKIYLSPLVDYIEHGETVMNEVTLRFFRRLIRDVYTRGASPEKTLNEWSKVRLGEKLYIDPFKHTANFTINSSHPYEVCVYRSILKKLNLLDNKDFTRFAQPFEYFKSLDTSFVPKGSLIEEFVD